MADMNFKRADLFNLILLSSLAFLIRFFFLSHDSLICPDCTQYVTIAKNFISKGQLISDGSHFPDIIQPPLYPLILSLFMPLFNDPELAGRIVSAIFGSLLIVPFFLLGQRIYNRKIAYIGSILIIFYPALIQFSIEPLTESVYIFFVYLAMLTGWIALERWSWVYFILAGAILGLSYLTRIEGLAYLLAFFLFSVLYSILKKRGLKALFIPTFILLGFLICILPYQVYVAKKMGSPFLVPKLKLIQTHQAVSRNLKMAGSLEGMSKAQKYERVYFGLAEDSSELTVNRLFFKNGNPTKGETKKINEKPEASMSSRFIFLRLIFKNLWQTYKGVYQYSLILPPGSIIFLVIGFFNEFWAYPHWGKSLFLFIMFLAGHSFILSHVSARFILSSIPIMILWQSIGIVKGDEWLSKIIDSFSHRRRGGAGGAGNRLGSRILLVLFLAISVLPATYMVFNRNLNEDDSLKKIGLWMKENISSGSTVIASRPQAAFYGGMKYLTLPYAEFNDIMRYAEIQCGDYLLLYNNEDMELRPFLTPLMKDGFTDLRLKLVKKMETRKGGSIYLYELTTKGDCQD